MSIRDIPITAKLMLLRAGAQNFKSIGKEMVINLTESSNLLCIANENGAGKSTLRKECIFYAMTGKTSHKGEGVDSLVNSDVFKNMKVFLEFHFAGQYYRIDRGRKPKLFSVSKLSDQDEWVELENLPVSDKDRQGLAYSLMGMDKAYAETLINSTILLGGDSFTSFLNLSTPERRLLLEPIFDVCIFSSLLKDLKNEKAGIVNSQAEVLAKVNDLKTKVALAEQSLQHCKTQKLINEQQYTVAKERLEVELSDCTTKLQQALEVDTSGLDLKGTCTESVKTLMEERTELEVKLTKDVDALGEFNVDDNDSVLVKLRGDITNVEKEIEEAQEKVKQKKASLGTEVEEVIFQAQDDIVCKTDRFNDYKGQAEDVMKEVTTAFEVDLKLLEEGLLDLNGDNADLSFDYKEALSDADFCVSSLIEAQALAEKYRTNIDKLINVCNSFTTKIEVEQENITNLMSEGDCPTCKQQVTPAWVEACKVSIQEKITGMEVERRVYDQRATAGEAKLKDLDLEGKTQRVLETGQLRDKFQRELSLSETRVQNQKRDIKDCKLQFEKEVSESEAGLASLTSHYEQEVQALQSVIDRAEDKATQALGEDLANLKALESSAPERIENLKTQLQGRESVLESDWGASKRHLQSNFETACVTIEDKILVLKAQLEKDLQSLIDHKKREVERCEIVVQAKENDIKRIAGEFNETMNKVESDLSKAYKDYTTKQETFTELEAEHDDLQIDLESCEQAILLCGDSEAKSDIVRQYIPKLNKDVNRYLRELNLLIDVAFDEEFNLTLLDEDRRGQSLQSLSAGQKGKLDLSIRLALRDLATSKQSVECNYFLLDEVMEPFSESSSIEACDMLSRLFSKLNLCVISQKNTMMRDLFDDVVCYELRGGFTTVAEED